MTPPPAPPPPPPPPPPPRKQVLLRLDPAVYEALARWASDELRSANAQIEFLLRRALAEQGRLPGDTTPIRRRGRPPKAAPDTDTGRDGAGAADGGGEAGRGGDEG